MIEIFGVSILNFIIFIIYMKFDQIKFQEKIGNLEKDSEKMSKDFDTIEHQLHLQEEMITRLETKIDLLLSNKINLN